MTMMCRAVVVALLWHVCHGASSAATQQVVSANTKFAFQLYRHLSDIALFGENVFFSPFSVSSALANVYAGAKGTTKTQMAEALNLDDVTENVHEGFRDLFITFNDPTNNYTLQVANGLFGRKGFSFLETYLNLASRCYDANLKTVDFVGDPDGSRKHINDWTAKKTNQKIKELFEEGAIDTDSILVIVNAIYFKGVWSIPFDTEHTVSAPFHLSPSRQVPMEMMTLKGERFRYADNIALDCKIVELPYAGDEVSMYVFLPNAVDGLSKLEKSLSVDLFNSAMSNMRKFTVDVIIPKFKLMEKSKLKAILMSMGMQNVFDAGTADLSGIDGRRNLVVSDVVHQAYVDVNEEGTEATAATGVHIQLTSMQVGQPIFKADHPFLFLIREKTSGSVLFMGRLNEPPKDVVNSTDTATDGGSSVNKAWQLSLWMCGLVAVWMLRHMN